MHRNSVVRAERRLLPDGAVDLLRGKHRARMLHQQAQDVIFPRRERRRRTVHRDSLGRIVQLHAADAQQLRLHRAAAELQIPPELRFHPRQHLHGVEWFCNVIVGAHVQAQDLIRVLGLRREQDDWNVGMLAQLRERFDTVHSRHHHVQQHKVDIFLRGHRQRARAVIGLEHLVVPGREIDFQRRHDVAVVVADQNVVHRIASGS